MYNKTIMEENNSTNQNSISNNKPSVNSPEISVPTSTPPRKDEHQSKKLLIIILAIVAIIAIGVSVYFLFFNNKNNNNGISPISDDTEPVINDTDVDPNPTGMAEEEYEDYINEQIATAESDVEALEYKTTKIILLFSDEKYDEAEAALNEIDVDSLKTYQEKFMVYNTYARLYDEKGDEDKFNEYHNLALQMHQAYIENEAQEE